MKNLKFAFPFLFLCLLFSCSSTNRPKTPETPEEKRAEIYFGHGTSNLINQDYTSALKNLLLALELSPKDTRIHNNLGMAYFFKKQHHLGLKHLKKSLSLDEKNSDARNNLASVYFSLGDYAKAEEEYLIVSKDLVYEQQFRVFYNLGLIKLKNGFPREAAEYFEESVKNNETYCPSHYKLGEMHFQSRNYALAYEKFYAASKGSCIEEPAPQYYQAVSLLKMNKLPEAKMKFEEVYNRFQGSDYAESAHKRLMQLKDIVVLKESFKKKKDNDKKAKVSSDSFPENLIDFTKENKKDRNMENTFATPKF